MPGGFEVFNEDGSLQFDGTVRLTKVLGLVWASGDGSIQDANFSKGQPWCAVLPAASPNFDESYGNYPQPSISGITLSWQTSVNFPRSAYIIYGTF